MVIFDRIQTISDVHRVFTDRFERKDFACGSVRQNSRGLDPERICPNHFTGKYLNVTHYCVRLAGCDASAPSSVASTAASRDKPSQLAT